MNVIDLFIKHPCKNYNYCFNREPTKQSKYHSGCVKSTKDKIIQGEKGFKFVIDMDLTKIDHDNKINNKHQNKYISAAIVKREIYVLFENLTYVSDLIKYPVIVGKCTPFKTSDGKPITDEFGMPIRQFNCMEPFRDATIINRYTDTDMKLKQEISYWDNPKIIDAKHYTNYPVPPKKKITV